MPKTMKERVEQAKIHQKNIAENRSNKKFKFKLHPRAIKKPRPAKLGVCEVCKSPAHIDKPLCNSCRVGLAMFKNDVELINRAIEYLNVWWRKLPDIMTVDRII